MECLNNIVLINCIGMFLFGICKGFSDLSDRSENYWDRPLGTWWGNTNLKYAYQNYKIGPRRKFFMTKYGHLFYLGLRKNENVEAFPYSSTALVFVTDSWHFFNFCQYRIVYTLIVFNYCQMYELSVKQITLAIFVILPLCQGLAFTLINDYIGIRLKAFKYMR